MKIAFYTSGLGITGGNKRAYFLTRAIQKMGFYSAVIIEEKYNDIKIDNINIISRHKALSIKFDFVIAMNPIYCDLDFFKSLNAKMKGLYILHLNDEFYTPKYQLWIDELSKQEKFVVLVNNNLWKDFYKIREHIQVFEIVGGYKNFEINEKLIEKKSDFTIIVNGNKNKFKGFNEVLRAIGRTKIKRYNILTFASRTMSFNSNHRMNIVFNIPYMEMWKVYLSGDLFIYFEDENAGWGNTAFEAIMCGIPVICTKYGTNAFAKHMKNSYIIERDVDILANAIELFYENSNILRGMNSNEKLALNKKFSYKTLATKILNIVKNN